MEGTTAKPNALHDPVSSVYRHAYENSLSMDPIQINVNSGNTYLKSNNAEDSFV
jgi:hypothetical protein